MTFFLGTHQLAWLTRTTVPLFISAVRMRKMRRLPKAIGKTAWDSGGFSQLQQHSSWTGDDRGYAAEVDTWVDQVGMPEFVAIRDWMCEPFMLAKTGKTIKEHQALTIESYATLMAIAPHIPWLPVLQGWATPDYLDHLDQYRAAGFDLRRCPVVGVGSICRRQGTTQANRIIRTLAMEGVRIHAFGVKTDGLRMFADQIVSADSMAWSFVARREPVLLDGCTGHKNCANCMRWALEWRESKIASAAPRQLNLEIN